MSFFLRNNLYGIVKKVIPKQIKSVILRTYRKILDINLSMTSEIPILISRNSRCRSTENNGKVYDCFLFFDELDILEIRLNILNDYVDYFVICEANQTFTGKNKPYRFQENYPRFEKFHHKIIYFQIRWSPTSSDLARGILHKDTTTLEKVIAKRTLTNSNVPKDEGQSHWLTEFFQKESMHLALKECDDSDIIYVSDVDEIWNPKRTFSICDDRIYAFKQSAYIYFLNNKSNEHWHSWSGSVVARYGFIKDKSLNDIRTHGKLKRYVVLKGGWHFSFQGGASRIIEKLDSYGHQELNTPEIINNVHNFISSKKDIRGRDVVYKKENKHLPEYILQNIEKYPDMFL